MVITTNSESLEKEIKELLHESLENPLAVVLSKKRPAQNHTKERLKDITSEIIRQQYKEWQGSKSAFAKKLGIGRTTLWLKLKGN